VTAATQLTTEDVRRLIAHVVDPCSRYNGSNIPLLDLGMIDAVRVDHDGIEIDLLLDDPSCVYVGQIAHELRAALEADRAGREVRLSLVTDRTWTTERLSPGAADRLGRMRHRLQLVRNGSHGGLPSRPVGPNSGDNCSTRGDVGT
jgi:metal-sulfur cluster biosynthetic enzyme